MKSKSGRNRRQPRKKRCGNVGRLEHRDPKTVELTFSRVLQVFFLMLKQRLTLDVLYGRAMTFSKAPLCIVKAAYEETRIYGWGWTYGDCV